MTVAIIDYGAGNLRIGEVLPACIRRFRARQDGDHHRPDGWLVPTAWCPRRRRFRRLQAQPQAIDA
jgi:hypothetical protein